MFAAIKTATDQAMKGMPPASPAPTVASRQANAVSLTLFFVMLGLGGQAAAIGNYSFGMSEAWAAVTFAAFTLIGPYRLFALKFANQWEKAVVLRFGKFRGLYGPGLLR